MDERMPNDCQKHLPLFFSRRLTHSKRYRRKNVCFCFFFHLPHMLSHPSTRHGNGGIRLLLLNSIRLLGLGDRWLMLLAIFFN